MIGLKLYWAIRCEKNKKGIVMDFRIASIDLETATSTAGSICEVAVAVFDEQGQYLARDSVESLVKPPGNEYFWGNTKFAHQLTAEDTAESENWEVVSKLVGACCADYRIIAHNAVFENRHLSAASETMGTWSPDNDKFICTLELTKHYFPELEGGHKLENIARQFDISFEADKLHRALPDAILCGKVFYYILRSEGFGSVNDLIDIYDAEIKGNFGTYTRRINRQNIDLAYPDMPQCLNSEDAIKQLDQCIIDNLAICITGTVLNKEGSHVNRNNIKSMALNAGFKYSDSRFDLLVVGSPKPGEASRKIQKYKENLSNMYAIDGLDFINYLQNIL